MNYYKWEALISFLREKERKNTSEGKKEKKKKRLCICPGRVENKDPKTKTEDLRPCGLKRRPTGLKRRPTGLK